MAPRQRGSAWSTARGVRQRCWLGGTRRPLPGRRWADLVGVEHFAREQLLGDLVEGGAVLLDERLGALVVRGHEALDLVIDADRGVLAVVLMLRDLAAEEDLLFLLAEGQ